MTTLAEAMTTLSCEVRFLTPAFLGNVQQAGQWRTPPFKALLRQWWRVIHASTDGFDDIERMRKEEGLLFGNAWLERGDGRGADFRQSKVRLRLDRWRSGTLNTRRGLEAHSYLGFGPLATDGAQPPIGKAAIDAGETGALCLAFPDVRSEEIRKALALMDAYGTLGGRSRNGWGSITVDFEGEPIQFAVIRPWREALKCEWPHAVGGDDQGPLIWRTAPRPNWERVMTDLARVKQDLRKQFPIDKRPDERHWLAYPVTSSVVPRWGNARLPNSLRFKVRQDGNGKLCGVIFHMPCLPPADPFKPGRATVEDVWHKVHGHLDHNVSLVRIDR